MDSELSRQKFEEEFKRLINQTALIKEHDWKISCENQDVFVIMHPKNDPSRKFMLRLRCEDYPQRPPSLQFVNPETRETGAKYWPDRGAPFTNAISRNPIGLCIPGNREFFESIHREPAWQWDAQKYPFAKILQDVQVELDKAYG
jgi:hypothetical protein